MVSYSNSLLLSRGVGVGGIKKHSLQDNTFLFFIYLLFYRNNKNTPTTPTTPTIRSK